MTKKDKQQLIQVAEELIEATSRVCQVLDENKYDKASSDAAFAVGRAFKLKILVDRIT